MHGLLSIKEPSHFLSPPSSMILYELFMYSYSLAHIKYTKSLAKNDQWHGTLHLLFIKFHPLAALDLIARGESLESCAKRRVNGAKVLNILSPACYPFESSSSMNLLLLESFHVSEWNWSCRNTSQFDQAVFLAIGLHREP